MAKVEIEIADDLLARARDLDVDLSHALALGVRSQLRMAEVSRDLDEALDDGRTSAQGDPITEDTFRRLRERAKRED